MADGSKLDCSKPDFTVDPDIVGPGVLAAFITTATITIAAVIFGYLIGALDDDLLNFMDRRVIHWTQTKWRSLKKFFRHVEETAIHRHPPHHAEAMAGIRKEVVTQFILTLSDQQLVTGLALLIAGVCNQRTLTGYQFAVILSQAWFSSTTHMTTLDALRNYLGSHGVVRDIRVFGMLSVLALLIYTFIVSLLTRPPRTLMLPVQCLFEEPLHFNPIYASKGGAAAYTLGVIALTYLFRIQDLYVRQRSPLYFIKWLIWRRRPVGSSYRQYFAENKARNRFLAACKLAEASRIQKLGYAYGGSFLASIAGIAFSFSYGVAQVVETRWKLSPERLPPEAGTMSFGQIMPLLLLCLPFLAAGESYYDYLHKRYQHLSAALEYYDEHVKHGHIVSKDTTELSITETHNQPQPQSASQSGMNHDLITAGEKYDQERSRIEKYFYADVHSLTQIKTSAVDNRAEVLQRKQSIASRYQSVEEFEKHIEIKPAVVFFFFNLLLASALGILLTAGNGTALEVCIGLGIVSIVSQSVVAAKAP